ncbi:hypothetical protein HY407_03705 [Candidatus Gottesmanbacteria bacterium]|nr:hypothetical protein [Candidatus Gottesmanbacteria bacterium]
MKDELNVKSIGKSKGTVVELKIDLDTKITPALKAEGEAREIIRQIQIKRKELGCSLTEKVTVNLPTWPQEYEEEIKKKTLAQDLIKSDTLEVSRL